MNTIVWSIIVMMLALAGRRPMPSQPVPPVAATSTLAAIAKTPIAAPPKLATARGSDAKWP
jgi:hypothetical protein